MIPALIISVLVIGWVVFVYNGFIRLQQRLTCPPIVGPV